MRSFSTIPTIAAAAACLGCAGSDSGSECPKGNFLGLMTEECRSSESAPADAGCLASPQGDFQDHPLDGGSSSDEAPKALPCDVQPPPDGEASESESESESEAEGEACRMPEVSPDDPLYPRFESPDLANGCSLDTSCFVGGCSGEVCTADPQVLTTCDALPYQPTGTCGCLDDECLWYVLGSCES